MNNYNINSIAEAQSKLQDVRLERVNFEREIEEMKVQLNQLENSWEGSSKNASVAALRETVRLAEEKSLELNTIENNISRYLSELQENERIAAAALGGAMAGGFSLSNQAALQNLNSTVNNKVYTHNQSWDNGVLNTNWEGFQNGKAQFYYKDGNLVPSGTAFNPNTMENTRIHLTNAISPTSLSEIGSSDRYFNTPSVTQNVQTSNNYASQSSSNVGFDMSVDYQAKINAATSAAEASMYNAQRNAKIDYLNATGQNTFGATKNEI